MFSDRRTGVNGGAEEILPGRRRRIRWRFPSTGVDTRPEVGTVGRERPNFRVLSRRALSCRCDRGKALGRGRERRAPAAERRGGHEFRHAGARWPERRAAEATLLGLRPEAGSCFCARRKMRVPAKFGVWGGCGGTPPPAYRG